MGGWRGGGNRQVRRCWLCFSLLAARLAVDVMIAKFGAELLLSNKLT